MAIKSIIEAGNIGQKNASLIPNVPGTVGSKLYCSEIVLEFFVSAIPQNSFQHPLL
jgi:hypothetical protein